MHFEARALRCFAVTAREGSVSRAAERLRVRQPTVSAQLRKLELALGFSLLHRTTRRIELTKEGKHLLPLVEALLADADRLKQGVEDLRGKARTHLRLGSVFYLQNIPERVALLEAFVAARPDIRLDVDSRLQASHVTGLLSGELEAALLVGYPIPRRRRTTWGDGELEFPAKLPRLVLSQRTLSLLVPPASPLARLPSLTLASLAGQSILVPGPDHGHEFVAAVSAFLARAGATGIVPAENTKEALARQARRSNLPALSLGWFRASGEARGELLRKPVDGLDLQTELALVFGKSSLGRPARALRAFARKFAAANRSG